MAVVLINVHLKNEILDPQGRAVLGAIGRFGLDDVNDVRQGKQFKLTIEGELSSAKMAEINQIAEKLLSNPVIEDFSVEVVK